MPYAGGMTRVGIPEYRLPRDVIQEEVDMITDIGVKLITNKKIKNYEQLLKDGQDAVLVAIGSHKGVRLPIEGNDLKGVYLNTDFLRKTSLNEKIQLGDKLIVLGGGNVAFDCARSAVRLGVKEVHLACLEDESTIPGSEEEVKAAEEEGIKIHYAKSFSKIIGINGSVSGIEIVDVESMSFDENKRLNIKLIEGSNHTLEIDNVIFATGQRPDLSEEDGFTLGRGNTIVVNDKLETNIKGIFAAGDVIYGTNSVIKAVASGREAATAIDKFLGGDGEINEVLAPKDVQEDYIGKIKSFGYKNRILPKVVDINTRKCNFDSAENGFSCEEATEESSRCLMCDLRLKLAKPRTWNDYTE